MTGNSSNLLTNTRDTTKARTRGIVSKGIHSVKCARNRHFVRIKSSIANVAIGRETIVFNKLFASSERNLSRSSCIVIFNKFILVKLATITSTFNKLFKLCAFKFHTKHRCSKNYIASTLCNTDKLVVERNSKLKSFNKLISKITIGLMCKTNNKRLAKSCPVRISIFCNSSRIEKLNKNRELENIISCKTVWSSNSKSCILTIVTRGLEDNTFSTREDEVSTIIATTLNNKVLYIANIISISSKTFAAGKCTNIAVNNNFVCVIKHNFF